MKIVFLGTGTSVGVPMIGCDCPVCTSPDPRNKRRRAGLYVVSDHTHVVVDTPPDFREQALAFRIPRVDAVLFTHAHADHVLGFDDIRRYNTIQDAVIPAYGHPDTIADLRRIFDYVEQEKIPGMYRPRIDFRPVTGAFALNNLLVEPLPVTHGNKPTVGYRLEARGRTLAYIPDCAGMAPDVIEKLRGMDLMILDALRHKPHPTHLTLADSVRLLQTISAGQSYITHMSHDLDHAETERALPEGIRVAYDGLTVEL